jgi:hypothetical protein
LPESVLVEKFFKKLPNCILKKYKSNSKPKVFKSFNFCIKKNNNTLVSSLDSQNNFFYSKSANSLRPIRLIKNPLNTDLGLLRFRFGNMHYLNEHKPGNYNLYLSIKQKKLQFQRSINSSQSTVLEDGKTNFIGNPILHDNLFIFNLPKNRYGLYNLVQKSKVYSEATPNPMAARLTRVKRTLVLPAHVNITLITNSYDIIHS